MKTHSPIRTVLAAALAHASMTEHASAHAFGARYDLPLPLWLYLTGAGAAVALTFVFLALFATSARRNGQPASIRLSYLDRVLSSPITVILARLVSLALFVLVLLTGLFGQQDTIHNFAPTFVWVIWWVGFALFVCMVGNAWPAFNPWVAVYDGCAWLYRRCTTEKPTPARLNLPAFVGVWPSFILLAAFAWLEIVSTAGETPRHLACLIFAYSAISWVGMILFGRNQWLEAGEAFHRYFQILGRFAPLGLDNKKLTLRFYGAGLVTERSTHPSTTAFVILILSIVTFDGVVETPLWAGVIEWIAEDRTLRPLLVWAQSSGIDLLAAVKTIAFAAFVLLFFSLYWGVCSASRSLAGNATTTSHFAGALVFSLVPIAIAYHVSHYLSFLLLAGQLIVPLASDPFGWNWDLFGTASRSMDIGIINAATVWYVAIVTIVLGHVIAVWLAHVIALTLYADARRALLSQIPLAALMVLYTMSSLWILSQPIVET